MDVGSDGQVARARHAQDGGLDLPQGQLSPCFAILEAKEGSLGIFTVRGHLDGTSHLCYMIRRIKDEGANGWHLNLEFDKIIPLPVHYRYCTAGAAEGCLLLRGIPEDWCPLSLSEQPSKQYFSLELKTFETREGHAELYTSFPGLHPCRHLVRENGKLVNITLLIVFYWPWGLARVVHVLC